MIGSNKSKKLDILIDFLFFLLGSFIFAVAINMFSSPNNIIPAGITGISTMINYLFGFPIGIVTIILNIPLFIWGIVEMGYSSILKTIIATIMSSVAIDLTKPFLPQYKGDLILACIATGVISGLGLALIFMRGGTTGGTDLIAALVVKHIRFISIGKVILIADIVIVAISIFVYKSFESPMYAIIVIFVSTKIIDGVLYGIDRGSGKVMFIISKKNKEISQKILSDIGRGVTAIKSRGVYSNTEDEMLLCAVNRHQVYKIYDIIRSIDSNAFVIVGGMGEIWGEGFKKES